VNTDAINAAIAASLLLFAAWVIRRSIQALRGADQIVADAINDIREEEAS
jgi:hypothetical protein